MIQLLDYYLIGVQDRSTILPSMELFPLTVMKSQINYFSQSCSNISEILIKTSPSLGKITGLRLSEGLKLCSIEAKAGGAFIIDLSRIYMDLKFETNYYYHCCYYYTPYNENVRSQNCKLIYCAILIWLYHCYIEI